MKILRNIKYFNLIHLKTTILDQARVREPAQVCMAGEIPDEQPSAPQDVQDARTVAGVAREQFQAAQRADPVLGRVIKIIEGDSAAEGEERLKRLAET